MKSIILSLAIAVVAWSAAAQPSLVALSKPFDEPGGPVKIIHCHNGNTLMLNFHDKDGLRTLVYNPAHELKNEVSHPADLYAGRKVQFARVDALFELNGNLVLFIEQVKDYTWYLHRVVVSTEDGHLVKAEQIGTMLKFDGTYTGAINSTHPQDKTFRIVRDDQSDHYAVLSFDGFAADAPDRISLVTYNGDHQELNRVPYALPDQHVKFVNLLGLAMTGGNVYLLTYAYNASGDGVSGAKTDFAVLAKDGKSLEHHFEPAAQNLKNVSSVFLYNPSDKTFGLMALALRKKGQAGFLSNTVTDTYGLTVSSYDAATMTRTYTNPVSTAPLEAYAGEHFGKRGRFAGMPVDLVLNADHTVSIVMEEITNTPQATVLGDLAVLDITQKGEGIRAMQVRKEQTLRAAVKPMLLNERRSNHIVFDHTGGFGEYAKSGFYSCDYVSGAKARYLIFNDHPDNFADREGAGAPQNVVSISGTNTACYTLADGKVQKGYLFGAPGADFDDRFALLSSGSYDAEAGLYTIMLVEQKGRDKQARIAWLDMK